MPKLKKTEKRKDRHLKFISTECNTWPLFWHRPEQVCKTTFINTREI